MSVIKNDPHPAVLTDPSGNTIDVVTSAPSVGQAGLVVYPVAGSNVTQVQTASEGPTNAASPADAALIGGKDGSGKLQAALIATDSFGNTGLLQVNVPSLSSATSPASSTLQAANVVMAGALDSTGTLSEYLNEDASGNLRVTLGGTGATLPGVGNLLNADGVSQAANAIGRTPAVGYAFNGATWDRVRNNFDSTTGDSGTKVATFNGATQTNVEACSAYITILLGTVSGSTPTLSAQLQWSPDAGTTWINLGAALPNLTASSQTGTILVNPNLLTGLTVGSTQSVLIAAPLPRTWRLVYTIAGSTPSFAISSVRVNYVKY